MKRRFYEESDFPQLIPLRENWERIRDEMERFDVPQTSIHRVGKTHKEVLTEITSYVQEGGEYGWLYGWGLDGVNRDWVQLLLLAEDRPINFLNGSMSFTLSLLRQITGVRMAALVRLKPNTFLPAHTHLELASDGILQMHLTLDAASEKNYAYLNVDGEFRQHIPGHLFVFDGSLNHFVINLSQKDRTILYLEFRRDGRPF